MGALTLAKDPEEVIVRIQFKNDKKIIRAKMTKKQFQNLKILPMVDICKVVDELGKKIPSDKEEELRKRLEDVLQRDTTHVKNISYD